MPAPQQAMLMISGIGGGGASEPDPTSITGATLWIDGTSSSLPGLGDGGAVGSTTNWIDRISGTRNFAQATAANRPTLHQTGGPNSQPYVSFDSTDLLGFSNSANQIFSGSAYTLFVVIRPQRNGVSGGPSGTPAIFDSGGGQWGAVLGSSGGNRLTIFQRSGGSTSFLNSTTVYSQNVWYIMEAWWDGSTVSLKVNNDTPVTMSKGGFSTAFTPALGNFSLTSDIAALYLWGATDIGSTSRDSFRTSLAAWFGISIP